MSAPPREKRLSLARKKEIRSVMVKELKKLGRNFASGRLSNKFANELIDKAIFAVKNTPLLPKDDVPW